MLRWAHHQRAFFIALSVVLCSATITCGSACCADGTDSCSGVSGLTCKACTGGATCSGSSPFTCAAPVCSPANCLAPSTCVDGSCVDLTCSNRLTYNKDNVQVHDLRQVPAATSVAACSAACCAAGNANCNVWQFCPSGAACTAGCWTGLLGGYELPGPGWISRSAVINACPQNTFGPVGASGAACSTCGVGTFSAAGSQSCAGALYPTGVSDSNALLPANSPDLHYRTYFSFGGGQHPVSTGTVSTFSDAAGEVSDVAGSPTKLQPVLDGNFVLGGGS